MSKRVSRESGGHLNRDPNSVRGSRVDSWSESIWGGSYSRGKGSEMEGYLTCLKTEQ